MLSFQLYDVVPETGGPSALIFRYFALSSKSFYLFSHAVRQTAKRVRFVSFSDCSFEKLRVKLSATFVFTSNSWPWRTF